MVALTSNAHFPPGIPQVLDIEVKSPILSTEEGIIVMMHTRQKALARAVWTASISVWPLLTIVAFCLVIKGADKKVRE